jgi:uncharacterized protein with PIN domain
MNGSFLADGTVERLMRWLRLGGLDVERAAGTDSELLRLARLSGRRILTRCRRLSRRDPERVILVLSDDPAGQLREILEREALGEPLSRCSLCNVRLEALPHAEAVPIVPPYVHEHHREFARCPSCRRVYWEGTHVERIRRLLADSGRTPPGQAPHEPARPRPGGLAA